MADITIADYGTVTTAVTGIDTNKNGRVNCYWIC